MRPDEEDARTLRGLESDHDPEGSSQADWLPYGPAWLVRCNAHNTTKPADTAATGDQLGTMAGRRGWCDQCAALGPTS